MIYKTNKSNTNFYKANKLMNIYKITKSKIVLPAICFIFAFILYSNTIKHSFVLDDNSAITKNTNVTKGVQGIPLILKTSYRYGVNNKGDNIYRPLSLIMFAIEWQISPNNPFLGHLINVLFYAISCLLLFIVLKKYMYKVHILIPLLITLLFTAHPIHTEVVANIKSRDEILSFFFLMLTLLSLHNWFTKQKWWSLVVSILMYFLAFLSKEGIVTMIFLFPVIGWYFTEAKPKTILISFFILIIPAIAYIAIQSQIISKYGVSSMANILDNFLVAVPDNASYYATTIMLLGKYLLLTLIPYQLVCDYGYNQIPIVGLSNIYYITSLLLYLVMAIYVILNIRKKSFLIFGLLFFLITLGLYSNVLFKIGTAFGERLLFLPSLGLCFAFIYFVAQWQKVEINTKVQKSVLQILKSNQIFTSILIIILLTFSVKTIVRASEWQSEEILFSNDIERSADSYHLSMWFGNSLYAKAMLEEDKSIKDTLLLRAIEKYEKAITIYPKYYESYNQLSLAWLNIGDINKGLSYAYKALALDSNIAVIWYNIGRANSQLGDSQKAIELYKKALKLDPNYADAYFNIGSILGMSKQYEEAIREFKKCIKANPDYILAYHYIGVTYQNLNQQEEADIWFEKLRLLEQKKKK